MQGFKEECLEVIDDYIDNECNQKGWPQIILNREELAGIRELKGKIKNHEIVVFKSDKCGKLTIDTTENYLEALKVHTESHEKIDLETASKIKGKMNEHLAHFNKIHKSH